MTNAEKKLTWNIRAYDDANIDNSITFENDGEHAYVKQDGVRIARREGDEWVPLQPGIEVTDEYENGRLVGFTVGSPAH